MLHNLLTRENGLTCNNLETPKKYIDSFYDIHQESTINSARGVIPVICKYITPSNILDVGCGNGALLKVWKEFGINHVLGFDAEHINTEELLINKNEFKCIDLNKGFIVETKFDLVTCLEVAEHLTPESSDLFVESLCKSGNVILFSAAIPGQEGTLHLNEQYPDYWVTLFANNGFEVFDCIRFQIWNDDSISPWYKQNIFFFLNKNTKNNYPEISKGNSMPLKVIHPQLFEYKLAQVIHYKKNIKNPVAVFVYFIKKYLKGLINFIKK